MKDRLVRLTRGQVAVIDDGDAALIAQYRWHATPNGMGGFYAAAASGSTTLYMHRLITGASKGQIVDHWNHDTLDNRRANLKLGTQVDNMRNGKFALATHCPSGHWYDPANTRYTRKGHRVCRACHRLDSHRRWRPRTPEQQERTNFLQRERRARARAA